MGFFSKIAPIAGAAIGGAFGGPMGAQIGGSLGGMIGGTDSQGTGGGIAATLPPYLQDALKQAVSQGTEAAEEGFTAFEGDRVASLTPDELQAFDMIRNNRGVWQQGLAGAQNVLGQVTDQGLGGIDPALLESYMNPHTQNVMDVRRERALENFDVERNKLRQQAGNVGAFGGSRIGLAESNMFDRFEQRQREEEANLLSQNFLQAQGAAERGLNRAATGAVSGAGLAGQESALGLQDARALGVAGTQQRGVEQAGLDFDFQEFLREEQDPRMKASFLAGLVNPIANTQKGSQQILPEGSELGTMSGIGAGLAGAVGSLWGSVGNNTTNTGGGGSITGGVPTPGRKPGSFAAGGLVADNSYQTGNVVGEDMNQGFEDMSGYSPSYASSLGGVEDMGSPVGLNPTPSDELIYPGRAEYGDNILVDDMYKAPAQRTSKGEALTKIEASLKGHGYGPAAIAGILGNIGVESGYTYMPDTKEKGGGSGHGLFQITDPAKKRAYSDFKGGRADSIETQIGFMHDLIAGDRQDVIGKGNAKKLRDALKNAKDPEEAAEVFMKIFEIPNAALSHLDRRKKAAREHYEGRGGNSFDKGGLATFTDWFENKAHGLADILQDTTMQGLTERFDPTNMREGLKPIPAQQGETLGGEMLRKTRNVTAGALDVPWAGLESVKNLGGLPSHLAQPAAEYNALKKYQEGQDAIRGVAAAEPSVGEEVKNKIIRESLGLVPHPPRKPQRQQVQPSNQPIEDMGAGRQAIKAKKAARNEDLMRFGLSLMSAKGDFATQLSTATAAHDARKEKQEAKIMTRQAAIQKMAQQQLENKIAQQKADAYTKSIQFQDPANKTPLEIEMQRAKLAAERAKSNEGSLFDKEVKKQLTQLTKAYGVTGIPAGMEEEVLRVAVQNANMVLGGANRAPTSAPNEAVIDFKDHAKMR